MHSSPATQPPTRGGIIFLLACWAAALLIASCTSTPPRRCGPDSELQEGRCVSVATVTTCAAGTTLNPTTNLCEPDTSCGAGTTYDVVTGECAPDLRCAAGSTLNPVTSQCEPDVVCSPATTLDPVTGACESNAACAAGTTLDTMTGACLADDRCGSGTTFQPATGLCLPDLVCAGGLMIFNDICRTPAEIAALGTDVVETTPDDNDPAVGGTAQPVALEPIGDALVITGNIARPIDLDGDMVEDQDRDAYAFTGSAGQLLRIRVLDDGLPAPTFLLDGPQGFVRSSRVGGVTTADRFVMLPYDGTYTLIIAPAANRVPEAFGLGGSMLNYVAVVEAVAWPTPFDVSPGVAPMQSRVTGQLFDLRNNFFRLTTGGEAAVRLAVETDGIDTLPVLLALREDGTFVGEYAFTRVTGVVPGGHCDGDVLLTCAAGATCVGADPLYRLGRCEHPNPVTTVADLSFTALHGTFSAATNPVVVVVDWPASNGIDSRFDLSVTQGNVVAIGAIGQNATLASPPLSVPSQSVLGVAMDLPGGEVVTTWFGQLSGGALNLVGPRGVIATAPILEHGAFTFLAPVTGTYRWLVINGGMAPVDLSPVFTTQTPAAAGPYTAAGGPDPFTGPDLFAGRFVYERAWVLADYGPNVLLEASLERRLGRPGFDLHDVSASGALVDRRRAQPVDIARLHALTASAGQLLVGITPGTVEPRDPAVRDWVIEVSAHAVPTVEVEPNDTPAQAEDLGALPARRLGRAAGAEIDLFVFTLGAPLSPGEVVRVHVENLERPRSPAVRILDSAFLELHDRNVPISTRNATGLMLLPGEGATGTGPFFVEVTGSPATPESDYVVVVERSLRLGETEPNEPQASPEDLGVLPALPFAIAGTTRFGTGSEDYFQFTLPAPLPAGDALWVDVRVVDTGTTSTFSDDVRTRLFGMSPTTPLATSEGEQAVHLVSPQGVGPYVLEVRGDTSIRDDQYVVTVDSLGPFEAEPNDVRGDATQMGPLAAAGAVTIWGIEQRGAIDWFALDLSGGLADDEVVTVRWENALSRAALRVTLYDDSGNVWVTTDRNGGELSAGVPGGFAGPMYVSVQPQSFTTFSRPEPYVLTARRYTAFGELEPNDDAGGARTAALPGALVGQGRSDDPDVWRIDLPRDLVSGEVIRVSAALTDRTEAIEVVARDAAYLQLASDTARDVVLDIAPNATTMGSTTYLVITAEVSAFNVHAPYAATLEITTP